MSYPAETKPGMDELSRREIATAVSELGSGGPGGNEICITTWRGRD